MITRRSALGGSLIASGAAVLGCALPRTGEAAEGYVSLLGAGSTFSAPLYNKWIDVYRRDHPQVSLSYDAVGSGEGIARFVHDMVDFGATDVLPPETTLAGVKRGVLSIPATAGMIVLAYNLPGLRGSLQLPRSVYSDIFTGRINKWDDPRILAANTDLDLPATDIAVIVRQDSSGTTAAFTRHLVAIKSGWRESGAGEGFSIDWPTSAMPGKGNEGVASKIKISEGSIGFVEYGFARRLGLQMAALQNAAGEFMAPSEASGQAALLASEHSSIADPSGQAAYPIVTFSWLLLFKKYKDPRKAAAVKDWVKWDLTTGQTYASALGYIPLPPETAALAERSLDSVS